MTCRTVNAKRIVGLSQQVWNFRLHLVWVDKPGDNLVRFPDRVRRRVVVLMVGTIGALAEEADVEVVLFAFETGLDEGVHQPFALAN